MKVLVVGLGGVGTMAAWRLAKAGHEVVGLEQFRLDHDRGSSYGDSRIVRRVYPDGLYTELMGHAYTLWAELNALYRADGQTSNLFEACGGLFFGPREDCRVKAAQAALESSGVAFDVWTQADSTAHFPALRLREDEVALHEPSMGFARASATVRFAARLARQHGAKLFEETSVVGIDAVTDGVVATLANGEAVRADRMLITAGAWTQPLLKTLGVELPLTVTRQVYVQLAPEQDTHDFEIGRFPVWIDAAANTYGFPALGAEGVKLALHDRGETTTPESVCREVTPADREAILRYARRRFVGLSDRVLYEKVCLYTSTPTEDFLLDTVPGLPAVHFVSACSGHGFKFTPLLGEIAASRMTGQAVPFNLARFRLPYPPADKTASEA